MMVFSIEWILRFFVSGVSGTLGDSKGMRYVVRLSLDIFYLVQYIIIVGLGYFIKIRNKF